MRFLSLMASSRGEMFVSVETEEPPPKQRRKAFWSARIFGGARRARDEQYPRTRGNPPPPQQIVGGRPVYVQGQAPPQPHEASRMPSTWRRFHGDDDSSTDITQPTGMAPSFNTRGIRNKFIRKVYLLLTVLLLYTAGIIALVVSVSELRIFFIRHWWVGLISTLIFMVVYLVLVCVQSTRKNFPLNFILLSVCTFFGAFGFAGAAANYAPEIILYSAAITVGVCALITLLACQPWIDVTGCAGVILILIISVMILGFVVTIIHFTIGVSKVLYFVYAGISAFVVCVYFLFITQLILGGKRYELSPEEYILAVIILYTEIMHLFLLIMQIVAGIRGS